MPPRHLAIAALLCTLAPPASGQILKGGGEFQISEQSSDGQRSPRIAPMISGGFVVVWSGDGLDADWFGVRGRRFASTGLPEGGDFQVNTWETGYQGLPSVAAATEEGFVVAWHREGEGDPEGVFARGFDASGAAGSGDNVVNAYTTGLQLSPSVAGASKGDVVITWTSWGQDGASAGIYGRRADPTGLPVGGEFRANVVTAGLQHRPEVSMGETGEFVVVWESFPQDAYGGLGVYGRLFDSAGAPVGLEIIVNNFVLSSRFNPDVAMNRDGEFVVAWQADDPNGPGSDIFARRFDSAGAPLGGEMLVNDWTTGFQDNPSVALDAFGNFMVVWESYGQDGDFWGVFGKLYDGGDQPIGSEFQVNSWTTGPQSSANVASVGPGDFVVAWHSYGQDLDGYGAFGGRFLISGFCPMGDGDADGVCDDYDNCPGVANPSQSDQNGNRVGDACDLAITAPPDGSTLDCSNPALVRPTFTWLPGPYDRFKVFLSPDPAFPAGQRLSSGDKLLPVPRWTPPKKKWKKACSKAAAANPSDPMLHVRVEGRDRDVKKSDPARKSQSPSIVVKVTY